MKPVAPPLSAERPPSRSTHARLKVKENSALMVYRDSSLHAGTRAKLEEERKLLKTQQSLDKQSALFALEVKKLKENQCRVAKRQQRMAMTAMKKYSVYLIQALYRGHAARIRCRIIRSVRYLGAFLVRRFHWRKRSRAARVIKSAYKRFVLWRSLKRYHLMVRMATLIQRNYRSHFLLRRAVLRRFTMTMWQHVKLFGVCRATHVVYPEAKHKRVIYRGLANFYRRLRIKRMENASNTYRVFYGLFFAETPAAKKRIESRSSSIVDKRRSISLDKRRSTTFKRQTIRSDLSLSLFTYRMENATRNMAKRENEEATQDILQFLRGRVIADQMKKFRMKRQSPPSSPIQQRNNGSFAKSPVGRELSMGRHRVPGVPTPPSSLLAPNRSSLHARPQGPTTSFSRNQIIPKLNSPKPSSALPIVEQFTKTRKSFGRSFGNNDNRNTSFNTLDSIKEGTRLNADLPTNLPTFDDVFNDYVLPKRLMKYRSTSQIDPNSMLANLKADGSDKLVPFELRGNYRLKTVADAVLCIQDLFQLAVKNPLVLQNPFDRRQSIDPNAAIPAKRDRSPRFIETFLPFNGTFHYSIFRRGAVSYDFESSAVYNKLSDLKLSSGKRALLRQHVIKTSAVYYEQERFDRRHFMNPMRKDQPKPPAQDIDTLDKIFLENFDQSESKKKKKRKQRVAKSLDDESDKRAQENLIREKILKMREEILQQQELIGALNGKIDDSSSDSDTTSTSSSETDSDSESDDDDSGSGGDSDGADDRSNDSSDDEEVQPAGHGLNQAPSAPGQPPPSFNFRRRNNNDISLLAAL